MIADEVMAGFGRAGAWFALDHYGVAPDLITFAKGVNSGYVPLGGVIVSDAIYDTFAAARLPRRADLLRPPARVRGRRRHDRARCARRASSRTPPRSARDVLGPGLRRARRPAPLRRRGPRASACSGRSSWSATGRRKEPLAPYGGTSPAMNEVVAACKKGGLLPFANFNRIHVVPPCNISDEEAREGLGDPRRALVGRRRACRTADRPSSSARRRPPAAVDAALAGARDACFWLDDVAGAAAFPALAGATRRRPVRRRRRLHAGCGPRCAPRSATPAAASCCSRPSGSAGRRPGATAASARPASTHGEENGRAAVARRVRRARPARPREPRRHRGDRRATSAWTVDFERTGELTRRGRAAPGRRGSREPRRRVTDGSSTRPRPCAPRSTARRTSPGAGRATTPRWCTRPSWRASSPASPSSSASRSSRAARSPASTRPRRRASTSAPPAARCAPTGSRSATNVFPSLLRRNRLLDRAGLRLRAHDRAADRRAARRRSAGATGRGWATSANQFHYYRLTADDRILFGGYDAVYRLGRRVRADVRGAAGDVPAARLALPHDVPAARGRSGSATAGPARSTPRTRFCAFFGTARRRPGGVRRRLHRARRRRDPVRRRRDARPARRAPTTERTRLEMVRQRPLPFPPEPVASLGIQATRWSLDRADHRQGRRNLLAADARRAGPRASTPDPRPRRRGVNVVSAAPPASFRSRSSPPVPGRGR